MTNLRKLYVENIAEIESRMVAINKPYINFKLEGYDNEGIVVYRHGILQEGVVTSVRVHVSKISDDFPTLTMLEVEVELENETIWIPVSEIPFYAANDTLETCARILLMK